MEGAALMHQVLQRNAWSNPLLEVSENDLGKNGDKISRGQTNVMKLLNRQREG